MDGQITTYLFTQGVLGVACLVEGIVIVYLGRWIRSLLAELRQEYKERLGETKEITDVLRVNSQANMLLAEKIEAVRRPPQ